MDVKKLFEILLRIAYRLNLIADYVIERGASGNWTWEKWNSGLCVAELKTGIQGVAITTAYGNMWRSQSYSYSLPSGLFKTVKTPHLDIVGDGVTGATTALNTSRVAAHLLCPFAHTFATNSVCFWTITVEGSWK